MPLLQDMHPCGTTSEEAAAVWVDCNVTDLLALNEASTSSAEPSEGTIQVAASDVRKVAARLTVPVSDDHAARIAAQVATHLREVIENEIEYTLEQ